MLDVPAWLWMKSLNHNGFPLWKSFPPWSFDWKCLLGGWGKRHYVALHRKLSHQKWENHQIACTSSESTHNLLILTFIVTCNLWLRQYSSIIGQCWWRESFLLSRLSLLWKMSPSNTHCCQSIVTGPLSSSGPLSKLTKALRTRSHRGHSGPVIWETLHSNCSKVFSNFCVLHMWENYMYSCTATVLVLFLIQYSKSHIEKTSSPKRYLYWDKQSSMSIVWLAWLLCEESANKFFLP